MSEKSRSAKVVRWLARIIATLLFLGLLTFAIGEGFPNPVKLTLIENVLLVGMLLIAAGLLVGWKWERLGGSMILIGVGTFVVIEGVVYHRFLSGWAFWVLAIPGLLYLFVGLQRK